MAFKAESAAIFKPIRNSLRYLLREANANAIRFFRVVMGI